MEMQTLLCFLLLFCGLSLGSRQQYVPHWLVKLSTTQEQDADTVIHAAAGAGQRLINQGKVGQLKSVYRFHYPLGERNLEYSQITTLLSNHPKVVYAEQERTLKHVLREFSLPTDPYWKYQWPWDNTNNPKLDINVIPVWEQNITGHNTFALIVDNGIQLDHPDLIGNIDRSLCYSVIRDSDDITPIRNDTLFYVVDCAGEANLVEDTQYGHGTSCAGEIAMVHDNNVCGAGVAYRATIGGFQFDFDNKLPSHEVEAFGFKSQVIQVSSNSWGPADDGFTVEGPGYLSQVALTDGVTNGRNGLGTVYVFSAGNGGDCDDSCAADGYASSIYTIAVGSITEDGERPHYEEECSAKMVSAFSNSVVQGNQVVATWPDSQCVRNFTGTSAAAPLVTGVILLALEVNPRLSWRDIQYLIVRTSKRDGLDGLFEPNGAGLYFNNVFGFGAIDANALVNESRNWVPVGPSTTITKSLVNLSNIAYVTSSQPFTLTFNITAKNATLEHVVLFTTFSVVVPKGTKCYDREDFDEDPNDTINHTGPRRGDVKITLYSPSTSTGSVILPYRTNDFVSCTGYTEWPFMSVQFWGEDPRGTWKVIVEFNEDKDIGGASVDSMTIELHTLQPEEHKEDLAVIIGPAVGGAVFLAGLLAVCCLAICCCCRSKSTTKSTSGEKERLINQNHKTYV